MLNILNILYGAQRNRKETWFVAMHASVDTVRIFLTNCNMLRFPSLLIC